MEKMYKINDNALVFPAITDITKVQVGETYNITHMIESGDFKGQRQARMYEYNMCNDSAIVTTHDGNKAFAIASNDCVRDNFPSRCLARIILEPGHHIIRAVNRVDHSSKEDITTIIIMQVTEIMPVIKYSIDPASVNVKVIKKFVHAPYKLPKLGQLMNAYNHLMMVHFSDNPNEFLMPKYCFNPGRITTNRLFIQQEDGDLISYLDDGKKLILNKKSYARYENPEDSTSPVRKSVFLRCFYPRIHRNDDVIFVDGAPLEMVDESNITEYIEHSGMSDQKAVTTIKHIRVNDRLSYFATTNFKETAFRPIYRTINGFGTFPLNQYEQRMNEVMYDIMIK